MEVTSFSTELPWQFAAFYHYSSHGSSFWAVLLSPILLIYNYFFGQTFRLDSFVSASKQQGRGLDPSLIWKHVPPKMVPWWRRGKNSRVRALNPHPPWMMCQQQTGSNSDNRKMQTQKWKHLIVNDEKSHSSEYPWNLPFLR